LRCVEPVEPDLKSGVAPLQEGLLGSEQLALLLADVSSRVGRSRRNTQSDLCEEMISNVSSIDLRRPCLSFKSKRVFEIQPISFETVNPIADACT
jgi:hypothetical protein